MTTLYISGYHSEEKDELFCPLQSSVVLFIAKYCKTSIKLVFVTNNKLPSSNICSYKISSLSDFCIEFSSWQNLPSVVRNVTLPSVHQPDQKLVRSGLCVVLRHIIRDSHNKNPSLDLIDLLGFRQGSMKMCAEVSSWTKLCEVDIPASVATLITELKDLKCDKENAVQNYLTIPSELMTLENHFKQKCLVHNDNKRQRAEISRLKDVFNTSLDADESQCVVQSEDVLQKLNSAELSREQFLSIDALSFDKSSHISIQQTVRLSHGVRKFRVHKNFTEVENSKSENCVTSVDGEGLKEVMNEKNVSENVFDLLKLKAAVIELSFRDIEYEHVYSEGMELTVADLILITYIYHLLDVMNFSVGNLPCYLQDIFKWTKHLISLDKVKESGQSLGWNYQKLSEFYHYLSLSDSHNDASNITKGHNNFITFRLVDKSEGAEEVELSRCAKMKHKALKLEVIRALKKFEAVGIQPVTGTHPKGEEVQVDWDSLPDGVHPKEGSVPVKRTQRKCQQLENLATAVQTVANPGDVIVDFCSGGGHLGILCAYLLPQCQVYLVENKEESLLKSSSRLQRLGLDNVTLYQCNMDYFVGKFSVGLCLHACGSATDMVLELCTKSQASFVICPCCYGGIHNTHLLAYPRSQLYVQADISYTDFLTIGHAADQTEFDIKLEKQGHECMNLVDTDRAEYAKEQGYDVTLCSLKPLTCSPKNNLLIGTLRNTS